MTRKLIQKAHGKAAHYGAELVVETPRAEDIPPEDAKRTVANLAERKLRGRPFQKGNKCGGQAPTLTTITINENAPEERQRIQRKTKSLKNYRAREMAVRFGGKLSSAVHVSLVAWASATAWADYYRREGDGLKAARLDELAAAHSMKAYAIAEREFAVLARNNGGDPLAGWDGP